MALRTSPVYRCLEKRAMILGFEIVDLFVVFSLFAILNLSFHGFRYQFFAGIVPSAALALGLRLGKRDKPENYLIHLVRHAVSPGFYSSFPLARARRRFLKGKR